MAMASPSLREILQKELLQSHFQPIVDLGSGQTHGYEALLRGPSGTGLQSPQALFQAAAEQACILELERAAFITHIRNFCHHKINKRLFLNLSPCVIEHGLVHGDTLLEWSDADSIQNSQIVIEVTENDRVSDYGALRKDVDQLRNSGLDIAIDDFGSGYSGLRQWSELQPEYVKIDRHFISEVQDNAHKRQFIHSIVEIARTLGSRVIAEGIETREELEFAIALGVDYGQGFYLARPAASPPAVSTACLTNTMPRSTPLRTTQTVGAILRHTPSTTEDSSVEAVAMQFHNRDDLRCVVITREAKPVGILTRQAINTLFASRYGRDLYNRHPVKHIMQSNPIIVSVLTGLDELSENITREYQELPEQDLIITDAEGDYLGTSSFIELLKAVTQLQIRSARYANPLTQLPGSVPINERIDQLLMEGVEFHVAYVDLDNFKPFNDNYGYAMGDDVIRTLGRILQEQPIEHDLIGHVGGDDFIMVMTNEDWYQRLEYILRRFETEAPRFYSIEDRASGGIHAQDRRGNGFFFPFLSLSIGVMTAKPYQYASHQEVSPVASEVKHQAKKLAGNSLFIDRRDPLLMVDKGRQNVAIGEI